MPRPFSFRLSRVDFWLREGSSSLRTHDRREKKRCIFSIPRSITSIEVA